VYTIFYHSNLVFFLHFAERRWCSFIVGASNEQCRENPRIRCLLGCG